MGLDKALHPSLEHKGSPYQMLLHNQRYYLMMFDEVFDQVGYYRLDKITNITILDEDAKPLKQNKGFEKGINYKEISTALPYMYNDKPIPVTIKCRNYMMDTISDWFGTDFVVNRVDDAHFTATIKASEKQCCIGASIQLQSGGHLPRVVAPKVIESLQKTLDKYEKKDDKKDEN